MYILLYVDISYLMITQNQLSLSILLCCTILCTVQHLYREPRIVAGIFIIIDLNFVQN